MEINLEKKETEKKLQVLENDKNKVIDELKFNIKEADNIKQLAISEAVKDIEKERDKLKNELNKSKLNIKTKPTYRDFRVGDVRHSLADISKAKNSLGYEAFFNISQGIHKAMPWYIKNLENYQ